MRIQITLKTKKLPSFVPFNYNYLLYSLLLGKINISNPKLADYLHSSKSFKFFTFSELFIRKGHANKKGIKIFSEKIKFYLSSPNLELIESLISGLFIDRIVNIKSAQFQIDSVKIIPDPDFSSGNLIAKTISPVLITTVKEENGNKKIWDLLPQEEKFYENICNNLYKKWVAFYSKEPPRRNLVIKPLGPVKTRRIQIKNNFHVASMMNLMLVGDPALIAFAYNTGLGQKNSMGFGMISVVS